MLNNFVFSLLTTRPEFFEVQSRVSASQRIHEALDGFSKNSYIQSTKGKQNRGLLTYFVSLKFQFTLNQYNITCFFF